MNIFNDVLDTYEGRPWEDLSDEELESIHSRGIYSDYDSYPNMYSRKAAEILQDRKQMEEEEKANILKEKITDASPVRELLTNGDYLKIGYGAILQKNLRGEDIWCAIGGSLCSEVITVSKKFNEYLDDIESAINNVITICRRKFRKKDFILCIFSCYFNADKLSGFAFTEDKLFTFDQGRPEYIIEYSEIEDVDFTDNSVTITVSGNEEAVLLCACPDGYKKQTYAKDMYNLIMDIKDQLSE